MNPTALTAVDLLQMLAFVAEAIAREESNLNALDAAIGDGDHGITMRVGFNALVSRVSRLPDSAGVDVILRESGMAFMGATGGAIGVLLGKMLIAGGAALKGQQEIGPAEFQALLGAMETALATAGKVQPGDKTILDAVHAAHQSIAVCENSQAKLGEVLTRAAQAARQAADRTAQMLARAGRASGLGYRALGHADPGAVSFSVVLGAMAEWAERNSRP